MTHVPSVLPTVVPRAPSRTTPNVKLPKLTMKFNCDLTKWTTFWDAFSSSSDAHPALSGIDKFNYLIYLLESTAAEAISGLTPTEANYEEAVARGLDTLLAKGHVPGTSYALSEKSWINGDIFKHWFEEHFLRYNIPATRPVLLLLDCHSSHYSPSDCILSYRQHSEVVL